MGFKNCVCVTGIFFLCLFPVYCFGQNPATVDSLRKIADSLPEAERLSYLHAKMEENSSNAYRLVYAYWLEEEAKKQQDETRLADALFTMIKHFYAVSPDSMRHRMLQIEPLLLKQHRYEDFFRIKGWDIYVYNKQSQKEKALAGVEELRALSRQYNFPEGLEIADQGLADFYFSNNMDAEGEASYLSALRSMEARNAPPIKRLNVLRHLSRMSGTPARRIYYLRQCEALLEQCKKEGMERLDDENSIAEFELIINRYLAREYLETKQLEEGWKHIQIAQEIVDREQLFVGAKDLQILYILYYSQSGKHEKVLELVEEQEVISRKRKYPVQLYAALDKKMYSLEKLGRLQEALAVSREMLLLKDSINKQEFNATLAEIRTKNEVEKLELESLQMEKTARQSRQLMWCLLTGCSILFIIILVLMNMMRTLRRKKEELRIAKEKAEEADQLKSAFLANMNHEIRTPLNAIVGFSQVLIEEEDKASREEFAGIIEQNNELLQHLIGDVLDISKIESNSMSLIYSEQNGPALMKELYNMISLRVPEQVKLIVDPCEEVVIRTDRNRLIQVLTNLLTNAVKHTAEGHIRMGYELTESEIRFYVEDTGEGIPDDQQENIFNRFTQLQNGKKGVGLGLAISKGLILKMGGTIWVESKVNIGSTFYVSLPRA
ncbi:HAMP domain-containing histidine kinase [Parabacteroides sp. OttesenSCG-928-K15]|nr:HAMP domain-containing histidine kinase [Parabacteroides sp. OttesenSCG-928-K15]